jgi:hypothetical protein
MAYDLKIIQKPTYLHAIVTGTNSEENVVRYLVQLRLECLERKCSRLLIEERLEGPRMGVYDVFRIASEGSPRALGQFDAVAYVDVNAQGKLMEFAAHVASERGMPVTVFATVDEAEKWLLELGPGDAAH